MYLIVFSWFCSEKQLLSLDSICVPVLLEAFTVFAVGRKGGWVSLYPPSRNSLGCGTDVVCVFRWFQPTCLIYSFTEGFKSGKTNSFLFFLGPVSPKKRGYQAIIIETALFCNWQSDNENGPKFLSFVFHPDHISFWKIYKKST